MQCTRSEALIIHGIGYSTHCGATFFGGILFSSGDSVSTVLAVILPFLIPFLGLCLYITAVAVLKLCIMHVYRFIVQLS